MTSAQRILSALALALAAGTAWSQAPAPMPEPLLDIAALSERLRDTGAMGLFAKIALRSQWDDLMKRFRAHHEGGEKASVAKLRLPYDLLVTKVMAGVQAGDPSLARTISGSREALWSILADRASFDALG